MASQDPSIVFFLGLLFGLFLLFVGFNALRFKQRIENTPTSKVRSVAMGPVEVNGVVVASTRGTLEAPFTGTPCVYYRYTVEEYRKTGKSSSWVTIDSGQDARLFFVKDDTGSLLVDSKDANVDLPPDFRHSGTQTPPERVAAFMERKKLPVKGLFFNKDMRYFEYHLAPGDSIFVTGEAGDNPFVEEGSTVEGYRDIMISKGKSNFFYISDKPEKQVLDGLKWQVWGGILGGLVLSVGSLVLLFMHWKIF